MISPETITGNMPIHSILFLIHPYFLSVLVGKPAYAREKGHGISGGKKKTTVDHLILFSLMIKRVMDELRGSFMP